MAKYNKEEVVKDLRDNVIEVTFIKVNGQRRVMKATLREDLLPPMHEQFKEGEKEYNGSANNKESIAVWDMDVRGWRSFRLDSIEYLQDINANY